MKENTVSGQIFITDPLNKFENVDVEAMCGLIPQWLDPEDQTDLYTQATNNYPYYSGDMEGGDFTDKYELTYPGDPDLPPLAQFVRILDGEQEVFCIYQYGIVAWFYKGEHRQTRMD